MDCLTLKENGLTLLLKVVPNSSKNEFVKSESSIKLRITAPPVDNKANKFVISFLSKIFKISKTSIEIIRGETSREKLIFIKTTNSEKCNFIKEYISNL